MGGAWSNAAGKMYCCRVPTGAASFLKGSNSARWLRPLGLYSSSANGHYLNLFYFDQIVILLAFADHEELAIDALRQRYGLIGLARFDIVEVDAPIGD